MKTLTISLPNEVELYKVKMIVATSLFERKILSSGQAAKLAGITRRQFLEDAGLFGASNFGETEENIEKVTEFEL